MTNLDSATDTPEPVVALTIEEQEALVPAPEGLDPVPSVLFVPIGDDGKLMGAGLEQRPIEQPYVSVRAVPITDPDVVVTLSGAPLTTNMNPDHTFYDAALAARNPIPGAPSLPEAPAE